ncbi:TadE family type IV pilus minor pilin [Cryptosporangium japonicum]|uniref:TadE family type IV pilus minor pilin n=1 Tax=Cryptosporangium japonicum TaxID=80872 RepID=A0ABP3EHG0_9ACTN
MTAELAAALPIVVLLLTAGLTVLAATTAHLRCVDAAREAARAASRGDPEAVAVGRRVAPSGARVRLVHEGGLVRVVVSAPMPAVGRAWPGEVTATAVAELEPDSQAAFGSGFRFPLGARLKAGP